MSPFKPAVGLAILSFIALQAAPAQPAPAASAASPGSYRSALDGYRPFTEEKLTPWKESNEAVRDAGGWRAYAREAQGDGGPPAAAAAMPAASSPHGGHQH